MNGEEKDAGVFNATFVRPVKFYIDGFSNVPHVRYFYIFLCFVYTMTVIGNVCLLLVICLVKVLHTPKYMIVFNMALADLCGSTALIPKLLDTFLFERRYIVYEACLSYMFFVLFFGGIQSYTLVTMAYDRFIAICFPLRYHCIVTRKYIAVMLLFAWLFVLGLLTSAMKLVDLLSFCGSLVIKSFYCDHGPIRQLACNSTSLNIIYVYVVTVALLFIPLTLIAASYICISIALARIASGQERLRALKTCTSHLILVAVASLPILSTNMASLTSSIHPNARIMNSTLSHVIPPLLNPIIYSLKTEEILTAIKKLWNRTRVKNVATEW